MPEPRNAFERAAHASDAEERHGQGVVDRSPGRRVAWALALLPALYLIASGVRMLIEGAGVAGAAVLAIGLLVLPACWAALVVLRKGSRTS